MNILAAAADGDLHTVQQMVAEGWSVTEHNEDGDTPLTLAARHGHTALVRHLLAAGAPVDQTNIDGCSPLCLAARHGHLDAALALLEAGADVDLDDVNGESPLHKAAMRPCTAMPQLLLQAGADVNHISLDNDTALIHAARAGFGATVQLLLAAGADANMCDVNGSSALMYAAARGQVCCVQLLLEAGAADLGDALRSAVNGRRTVVARTLLPLVPVDAALSCLVTSDFGLALLPELLCTRPPLSDKQWSRIPAPCPPLTSVLGTVLSRPDGTRQGKHMVRRLVADDVERLHAALACFRRNNVPKELVYHLIALAF